MNITDGDELKEDEVHPYFGRRGLRFPDHDQHTEALVLNRPSLDVATSSMTTWSTGASTAPSWLSKGLGPGTHCSYGHRRLQGGALNLCCTVPPCATCSTPGPARLVRQTILEEVLVRTRVDEPAWHFVCFLPLGPRMHGNADSLLPPFVCSV
jgi:hypothetical protein